MQYINWSLFVVEMEFIVVDVATNWLFVIKLILAVDCLKDLVSGLSPHWPEFQHRLDVGFVVEDCLPAGTSGFSSINFPPIAHLIVIFSAAVNIGKTGRVWEPSTKTVAAFSEIGDH